jgi:hypothetical protein
MGISPVVVETRDCASLSLCVFHMIMRPIHNHPTGRNYVKPNHNPPHILARMNNIFRGLIAGYGAKKLGGGCLGTVIVFVIIWMLLGQC